MNEKSKDRLLHYQVLNHMMFCNVPTLTISRISGYNKSQLSASIPKTSERSFPLFFNASKMSLQITCGCE